MPHCGIEEASATSSASFARANREFSTGSHDDRRRPMRTLSWRMKSTQSTVDTTKNAAPGASSSRVSSGKNRPWRATNAAAPESASAPLTR